MNQDGNSFKSLKLWQDAQAFAVDTCELAHSPPNTRSADVAARQLIRSATSIAANVVEGHGRFSLAAYRNHSAIARGSATETRGWIDLLIRRRQISSELRLEFDSRCGRLIAGLTARIRDLERKLGSLKTGDGRNDHAPFSLEVRMPGSADVPGGEP